MSVQQVDPEVVEETGHDDDDVSHYVCALDPDVSYCGKDLSGRPPMYASDSEEDDDCPLCVLVWGYAPVCVKCGREC